MPTSTTLINAVIAEFDKKFPQLAVVVKWDEPLDNVTAEVRNFLRTHLASVALKTVGAMEVPRKILDPKHIEVGYKMDAWNAAIDAQERKAKEWLK